MRTARLLFSAFHFFIIVFLIGLAAFFFGLPSAPKVRHFLVQIFTEESHLFYGIGAAVLVFAILLLVVFYSMNRGQYYQIKMNRSQAMVDMGVIQQYVERYWAGLFPGESAPIEVGLSSKQEIQITAEMSGVAPHVQKQILEKVEGDLGEILAKKLGYHRDFLFTVVINKD